ncbi:MAG: hypothetical protein HOP19_19500 [Acidobacteria bacterium]|nr:hypothetical protein [Acidobacteriota bacterium]
MNQAAIEFQANSKEGLGQPVILNQSDVRKQFRISRSRQWQLRKSGKLGYLDFGNGRVAYFPEHIEEYLKRCEHKAASGAINTKGKKEEPR